MATYKKLTETEEYKNLVATDESLQEQVEAKQDKLTAGNNITISGNTISATGTSGSGTAYSVMKGASATSDGTSGLVPAPAAGKQSYVLTGGGAFQYLGASTTTSSTALTLALIVGGVTVKSLQIPVATTTAGGLLSASDKAKLDSLDADATATAIAGQNTNYVSNIAITQSASHPDWARFTVQKGNSTQYSFDLNNATATVQGLMSAKDKAKLDAYPAYSEIEARLAALEA